jgi:hypothetical protein
MPVSTREQYETTFGYILRIQPQRYGSLAQPLSKPRIWVKSLIRSKSGTSQELGVETQISKNALKSVLLATALFIATRNHAKLAHRVCRTGDTAPQLH